MNPLVLSNLWERAKSLRTHGATYQEIAAETSIPRATLARHLREFPRGNRGKLKPLLAIGLSTGEIAKRTGFSKRYIQKRRKEPQPSFSLRLQKRLISQMDIEDAVISSEVLTATESGLAQCPTDDVRPGTGQQIGPTELPQNDEGEEFLGKVIGQRSIKQGLKKALEKCLELGLPLPSMILFGNPGLGKTYIARAIGGQMGRLTTYVNMVETNPEDFVQVVSEMGALGILILDECHSWDRKKQDVILPVLDAQISMMKGGPVPTKVRICKTEVSLSPFTIIFCTNNPQRLNASIRRRLHWKFPLEPYSQLDLEAMAKHQAAKKRINLVRGAAEQLAMASQRKPSSITSLIDKMALSGFDGNLDGTNASDFLLTQGFTSSGLTIHQINYLKALSGSGTQGAAISVIAERLQLHPEIVEEEIEPELIARELVMIKSRRLLTLAGIQYLKGM